MSYVKEVVNNYNKANNFFSEKGYLDFVCLNTKEIKRTKNMDDFKEFDSVNPKLIHKSVEGMIIPITPDSYLYRMNDFERKFQISKWHDMEKNMSFVDNPVHFYLKNNQNKKLSINTIGRGTGIKRRKLLIYAKELGESFKVNPLDVGSNKYPGNINVYQYSD